MTSFACPLCCHEKFGTVLALREHLMYFLYRPLMCVLCRMTIGGIFDLIHHLQMHLNSDKPSDSFDLRINSKSQENVNDFMSYPMIGTVHSDNMAKELNSSSQLDSKSNSSISKHVHHLLNDSMQDESSCLNQTNGMLSSSNSEARVENDTYDEYSVSGFASTDEAISSTCSLPLEQNQSFYEEDYTECIPDDESTREPIQAFVCKMCGAKIIGKNFYFAHLQANCNTKAANWMDQIPQNNQIITGINELKSTGPGIQSSSKSVSNEEFAKIYSPSCKAGENSYSQLQFSYEEQRSSNQLLPLPEFLNSIQASPQIYIHKKFDHDQNRAMTNHNKKASQSVQCYIQNFQSLLVNKLNQAFENDPQDHHSLEKSPLQNEQGDGAMHDVTFEENTPTSCHDSHINKASPKQLPTNEKVHLKQEKYKCLICSKFFLGKSAKENHHCQYKSFTCKHCPKSFKNLVILHRHQREVHSNKKISCNLCGRHFQSHRTLSNHKGIHRQKQFYCEQCNYVCYTASGLRSHIYEKHLAKKIPFACKHCGEKFKRNYGLKRHIERKHQNENCICQYCDKKFNCLEDLKLHLKTHLKCTSLTCNICSKIFTTLGSLRRHETKHKQISNVFKCDVCSSVFTRKDSLLSHMNLHNSDRKFSCKCGKGFNKQSQLKNHARKHAQTS